MLEQFLVIVKEFGFPIALVVYLLWTNSKRQKADDDKSRKLGERLSTVEDYQRTELTDLITKTTTSLNDAATAIKGCTTVIEKNTKLILDTRAHLSIRPNTYEGNDKDGD